MNTTADGKTVRRHDLAKTLPRLEAEARAAQKELGKAFLLSRCPM